MNRHLRSRKMAHLMEQERVEQDFRVVLLLGGCSLAASIGFFILWYEQNRRRKKTILEDLRWELKGYFEDIDINVTPEISQRYIELLESFQDLLGVERVWDITASKEVDRKVTRSAASERVTRHRVNLGFGRISKLHSRYGALYVPFADGGGLLIYPAYAVQIDGDGALELYDIRKIKIDYSRQYFVESAEIPADAIVVGQTWAKVNDNGSPDQRFSNNYEIPIVQYGEVRIACGKGLDEVFSVSSAEKARAFVSAFRAYQEVLMSQI